MKRTSLIVSTLPGLLAVALLGCGASPATGTATSSPAAPSQSTPAAPSATPQVTSPAAQSGSLDVCALATQAEIDAAAGVSLGPATPQPPPNPGSAKCSWPGSGAPVAGLFEPGITISAITLPTGTPVSSIPPFNGQPPSARHISGLADVAVSLAPGQLGPDLSRDLRGQARQCHHIGTREQRRTAYGGSCAVDDHPCASGGRTLSVIRAGRVYAPTALCAAAGLALSGCGSSSNAAAPQGSSGGHLPAAGLADNVSNGSANVTLAPGVVEIKRNDVANELTSVSPDGSTYTFNGTAGRVADLHTGSVMFLQGTSIRRVTSVSTSGGATVVATAPASLTDAISSGTVKFTQPVALAQGAIEPDAPTPPGDYVTTPSATPSAAAFRGIPSTAHLMSQVGQATKYVDLSSLVTSPLPLARLASVSRTIDGWDTTMGFTPGSNRIDFTLMAIQASNPKVTLSATGYIQNFIAAASFDVASGSIQNASFDASQLNGAVDFTWQASTDIGIGDHTLIHIPIKLEVPVIVGELPFEIGVGAALNAGIGFSSKNSTSEEARRSRSAAMRASRSTTAGS